MENQKITLITGANRGMGLEIAKELGQKGQLILLGVRDVTGSQKVLDQLRSQGVRAELVSIDVTNEQTVEQAVKEVEGRHGHLDILINNAGIALDNYEKPSTLPISTIRKDFEVNFFGTILVTQNFLPLLRKSTSGKIINISSAVGSLTLASDPSTSIYQHSAMGYQASKSALNMFTIDLANELKETNITANVVNPGWVDTTFAGGGGNKTVEEGVQRTVELATMESNDINGTFSDSDGIVPW
ncbi:SDR family oxidoreductase [Pediococcus claussenii]|uniref:Short chain dehydrogenase family protein n=1 Tax=Pediococcus claussenii (strain ATCC BAA-344 / DSM 14800 / JCM 18046 / KCTC 3811 / LMG 21948 / P06) TaxID=701521 RepID=G8PEX9_PEDCP|nr:SDR family oxidoreductase [Pediococcus claussenii]AEV95658.1 short chain dehydrogenase family protein [Pediococcus claussenii ATCC BAA-344]KRN20109.1 hypothetical protein IV79_GL000774 [Pediococcus claussenii]